MADETITGRFQILTEREWTFLRDIIDGNCPFHDASLKKEYEGTSLAGMKHPCYHLTLGKIRGIEIALSALRGD